MWNPACLSAFRLSGSAAGAGMSVDEGWPRRVCGHSTWPRTTSPCLSTFLALSNSDSAFGAPSRMSPTTIKSTSEALSTMSVQQGVLADQGTDASHVSLLVEL